MIRAISNISPPFLAETSAFLRLFWADVKKADEIGSREIAIGVLAPFQVHPVLGRGESDTRECVAVDHDVDSAGQRGLKLVHLLPAVGGKKQVDAMVVLVFVALGRIRSSCHIG